MATHLTAFPGPVCQLLQSLVSPGSSWFSSWPREHRHWRLFYSSEPATLNSRVQAHIQVSSWPHTWLPFQVLSANCFSLWSVLASVGPAPDPENTDTEVCSTHQNRQPGTVWHLSCETHQYHCTASDTHSKRSCLMLGFRSALATGAFVTIFSLIVHFWNFCLLLLLLLLLLYCSLVWLAE